MRYAPALVGVAVALASVAAADRADAAKVLLFYSSRYVHVTGSEALPAPAQEADNVKAALGVLGHTVTTIAGPNDPVGDCGFGDGNTAPGTLLATADEYRTALAAADVFLVPEHARYCSLAHDLPADVAAAWRTWVADGGGLVIHTGYEGMTKVPEVLQIVFGFHLGGVLGNGVTTHKTPAAAQTLFAAAPATLRGNDETGLVPLSTLPPRSISAYDDGTNASVAVIPYGAGKVIILGWDWGYADPPFSGEQNGGWFPAVLEGAIQEARSKRLTVTLDGSGGVTGSPAGIDAGIACGTGCAAHYPRGTVVTLTAAPAPGWIFTGWGTDACPGTGACTLALAADTAVTARFVVAPPGVATLAVALEGTGQGAVVSSPPGIDCPPTCAAAYPAGTALSLTPVPAADSLFTGWGPPTCPGLAPCDITVTGNETVAAMWQRVSGLAFALGVVPTQVAPGSALRVDLALANPAAERAVDVYFGVVLPPALAARLGCDAAGALAFVADAFARVVPVCASASPAALPALFHGLTVPASTAFVLPGLWQTALAASLPPGAYTVFVAATPPDALAAGHLDPNDLLAVGQATFTLSP